MNFNGGPPWARALVEMLSGFQITRVDEGSASLRRGTAFLLNSLPRGGGLFCFELLLLLWFVVGLMALPMKRRPPR